MGCRVDIYNWPPVYISWGEKKDGLQAGHSTASLLFAFPETGDRGAPDYVFTTSLLFAL